MRDDATRAAASEHESRPARRLLAWEPMLVMATTFAAAVLMARSLDAESLWIDEAISVHVAQLGASDLWRFVSHEEMNMALYHVILNAWVGLGSGEAMVRVPSVLFAALTVPMLYGLGARLFSPRVGVIAASLLALNATLFSYGRETRSYALTVLLVVLASYFFVRAVSDTRRMFWAAYAITAVLAVYSHLFAVLVLIGHAGSLIGARRQFVASKRTLAATAGGIVLALLPVGVYIAGGETGRTTDQSTAANDVPYLLIWYAGSNRPLAAVYALAALGALVVAWRRGLLASWPYAFVLAWLTAPILLALAISVTIDPLFVPRYLLFSLPALLLLVAVGISAVGSRILFAAALAVVSALSLRAMLACHPGCQTPTQDFRAATSLVLANAGRGDGFFFDPPYLKVAFVYYASRSDDAAAEAVGCRTPFCGGPEDQLSRTGRPAQTWLLIDDGDPKTSRTIPDDLGRRYGAASETSFPSRLRVVRYTDPR